MLSKMRSNHHHQIRVLLRTSSRSQAGFAMIEVLVGMMIMTLFIGISMQFMVYSSLLKARSQQYAEAMTWIQQDLEQLKYQATGYKSNVLKVAATVASSSISLTSAQNFEVNDKVTIGADSTVYTISAIAGNTLTIAPAITVASPINAPVVASESVRCNKLATPATITTGIADGFRDSIVGSDLSVTSSNTDTTKTSNLTNKKFRFRRTISIANIVPYNVSQINYNVSEVYSGGSFGISVADVYAEIVPSISFSCAE